MAGDGDVAGKLVLVGQNALVGGLDVLGLVRGLADEGGEADDAHGPYVDLEGMPALLLVAVDDLRGDVVGGAADGLALLVGAGQAGGETKVSDLDVEVLVEEEVAELEVAVDDVDVVHVADGVEELLHVVLDLRLRESLPSLDHFVHGLVVAQLEKDVAVDLVLEEVLVLADIVVFEAAVDLDLGLELLSGPGLDEVGLGDDLDGVVPVGVEAGAPVHLGKAALAEKPSSDVAMDGVSVAAGLLAMLHDFNLVVILGHHLRFLSGRRRGRLWFRCCRRRRCCGRCRPKRRLRRRERRGHGGPDRCQVRRRQ
mmetsp:Transcript_24372/g.70101  ORF Transcript_24372/g.70101 Transcript_24372/m.70101 type:complete len:311 (-) Transcript_24372:1790-2722(-)